MPGPESPFVVPTTEYIKRPRGRPRKDGLPAGSVPRPAKVSGRLSTRKSLRTQSINNGASDTNDPFLSTPPPSQGSTPMETSPLMNKHRQGGPHVYRNGVAQRSIEGLEGIAIVGGDQGIVDSQRAIASPPITVTPDTCDRAKYNTPGTPQPCEQQVESLSPPPIRVAPRPASTKLNKIAVGRKRTSSEDDAGSDRPLKAVKLHHRPHQESPNEGETDGGSVKTDGKKRRKKNISGIRLNPALRQLAEASLMVPTSANHFPSRRSTPTSPISRVSAAPGEPQDDVHMTDAESPEIEELNVGSARPGNEKETQEEDYTSPSAKRTEDQGAEELLAGEEKASRVKHAATQTENDSCIQEPVHSPSAPTEQGTTEEQAEQASPHLIHDLQANDAETQSNPPPTQEESILAPTDATPDEDPFSTPDFNGMFTLWQQSLEREENLRRRLEASERSEHHAKKKLREMSDLADSAFEYADKQKDEVERLERRLREKEEGMVGDDGKSVKWWSGDIMDHRWGREKDVVGMSEMKGGCVE